MKFTAEPERIININPQIQFSLEKSNPFLTRYILTGFLNCCCDLKVAVFTSSPFSIKIDRVSDKVKYPRAVLLFCKMHSIVLQSSCVYVSEGILRIVVLWYLIIFACLEDMCA